MSENTKKQSIWEKIGLFLGGVVGGIFAFLVAQRFSRRYRDVKKQLQSTADKLRNITDDIQTAEQFELLSADESKRIGDLVDRERAIIGEVGAKLTDDAEVLGECENKLRESRDIIAECSAIMERITASAVQI